MTLVDVDGNGTPDHLLVGAPPTHAYLYALPLSTGQAPVDDGDGADASATSARRSRRSTSTSKPGDEMFVGDPDAAVGGTTNAGHVTVYTGPDDDDAGVDDDVPQSARGARSRVGARLRLGHRRA